MELNNSVETVEVKKLTIMDRIKFFFTNPNKIFEDYKVKPTWLLKTIVILALTIIAVLITTKVTVGPQIDLLMQRSPDMTREQAENIMSSPMVMAFALGGGLFSVFAAVFATPLIYWGLLSLFGGKTTYMRVVAVYTLAYIPASIGAMINIGFAYFTNNFDNMLQPEFMDVILQRLDLFVIWQVLLLIFGFAKLTDLKPAKAAIPVILMWLIATGIAMIPVFTNRMF